MSGRIWVVEANVGSRKMPEWHVIAWRATRAVARKSSMREANMPTRVVQYVRQGGAR